MRVAGAWLARSAASAAIVAAALPVVSAGPMPPRPEDFPLPLREWALGEARQRFDGWLSNKSSFEAFVDDSAGVKGWLSYESLPCGSTQNSLTGGVPEMFIEYYVDGARAIDVFNVIVECGSPWSSGPGVAKISCELLEDMAWRQAQGIRSTYMRTQEFASLLRESTSWRVASANFTEQEFYYIETNQENQELLDRHPPNPENAEQDTCFYGLRIRAEGSRVRVSQTSLHNPNYKFWMPRSFYKNGGFSSLVEWVGELRTRSRLQFSKNLSMSSVAVPDFMLNLQPCTHQPPQANYRRDLLSLADEELQRSDLMQLPPRRLPGGELLKLSRRLEFCGGRDIESQLTPVWHGKVLLRDAEPVEVFTMLASKLHEATWNSYLENVSSFNTDAIWSRGLRSQYTFKGLDLPFDFDRTIDEWQVARHNRSTNTYLVVTRSDLSNVTKTATTQFGVRGFSLVPAACNCLSAYEASDGPDPNTTLLHFSIHINPHSDAESEAMWDMIGPDFIETFAKGIATSASRIHEIRGQNSARIVNGVGKLADIVPLIDDGVLALLVPPPPNGRFPHARLSELNLAPMDEKKQIFLNLDIVSALSRHGEPHDFKQLSIDLMQILRWANAYCESWLGASHWCETLSDTFQAGLARDKIQLQQQGWALGFVQEKLVSIVCQPAPSPAPDTPGMSNALSDFVIIGLALLLMLAFVCVQRSRKRRRVMLDQVYLVSEGLEEARGAHSEGRMFMSGIFGSRRGFSSSAVGDPQRGPSASSTEPSQ